MIFISVVLALPGQGGAWAAGWQWIAPQRVLTLLTEGSGLWLVDVRNKEAFEDSHIEGAMNIPADVLESKRLPKGKMIVLVDDSLGSRKGREAAQTLAKNGNERIFLLEGGMPAWQDEGMPLTGKGTGRIFRRVMPDELDWAIRNRIPLRIYDLRGKSKQAKGLIAQAMPVEGKDLAEKLAKASKAIGESQKKGIAAKLAAPLPIILVFPEATDPVPILEKSIRGVCGDIRYLEGSYATWTARPARKTATSPGGCPTCPGGGSGGKK